MKKLIFLTLFLPFISCKKTEVSPNICYIVVTDETTVHGAESPLHYPTQGKAITVQVFNEKCNLSIKDVLSFIKSIDGTEHPSIGVCIVRSSHYYRIKN
jgi:hypothetical protein